MNEIGKSSPCILWEGKVDKDGYGYFCRDGKTLRAHRYAYEQAKGPIEPGLFVRHDCDTPACYNPDHLRTGTVQENNQDMVERRRYANMRKTHCPKGHEYSGENLIIRKSGRRRCRTCHNNRE